MRWVTGGYIREMGHGVAILEWLNWEYTKLPRKLSGFESRNVSKSEKCDTGLANTLLLAGKLRKIIITGTV